MTPHRPRRVPAKLAAKRDTLHTQQLTRIVARKLDVPNAVAGSMVHAVLGTVADALASGQHVTLLHIGHLHVSVPEPREGQGLFRGRIVASRASIKFTPTRALIARLRGTYEPTP